MQNFAYIFGR